VTTITPAAPTRSLQQRLDALRDANDVRSHRARLKRDLKAGRASVVPVLIDPPEWLLTMAVVDLLLAMPRWGRVRVGKLLKQCVVSPSRTVGRLSPRERT